jgi:hypothetical protein
MEQDLHLASLRFASAALAIANASVNRREHRLPAKSGRDGRRSPKGRNEVLTILTPAEFRITAQRDDPDDDNLHRIIWRWKQSSANWSLTKIP